jgi:hypothetical protein
MSRDKREDIEVEIARLRGLDIDGLRLAWRAVFGKAAADHLPKHILMRILAYRLQAEAFGDLSRSTVQLLGELARTNGEVVNPASVSGTGRLRPGTVLVREHERKRHHVMVVPEGFAWNGKTYPSLSKVAYAVTGTKWNGPRFFGLREKQS